MQLSRGASIALITGFVVVLLMPAADTVLDLDPAPPLKEWRKLAEIPKLSWKLTSVRAFPSKLEAYIDDHFGFRRSLVRLHGLVRLFLSENTPGSQVIIGREGWLYHNSGEGLLDDHRGFERMTDDQLQLWKSRLEERRNTLAERGIKYLFVIAPRKYTIYPEFVPTQARKRGPNNQTDQLFQYLKEKTTVAVVDLRQALKKEKTRDIVYHRTDTHWNDLGAWVAYREIQDRVAKWFPGTQAYPLDDFWIVKQSSKGWKNARLLALQDHLIEDEMVVLRHLRPQRAFRTTANTLAFLGKRPPFAMETGNTDLPRAVVFRDSFGTALVPFLSEHYERVVYYWQAFEWAAIQHEAPNLVIEELNERGVVTSVPDRIRPQRGLAAEIRAAPTAPE